MWKERTECQCSKSKVMIMNGEEGLECEIHVDGVRLEHAFESKYLGCCFGRSRYRWGRMYLKVASGK